jgi:hypothetical protein
MEPMKLLFVMDPLARMQIAGDTTSRSCWRQARSTRSGSASRATCRCEHDDASRAPGR